MENLIRALKVSAITFMLAALVVIGWDMIGSRVYYSYKVKPNQVWEYKMISNNPFEQVEPQYHRVLSVKDGYVQYVDSMFHDTTSCTTSTFVWSSTCIK